MDKIFFGKIFTHAPHMVYEKGPAGEAGPF